MTSVVVSDGGGNIVEYVTVVEELQQVSLLSAHTARCGDQRSGRGFVVCTHPGDNA